MTKKNKAAALQTHSKLYYGDNLEVLRKHVKDESIDLIYLDPPFNSKVNYNIIFKDKAGHAPAQIRAFNDTWTWTSESEMTYGILMDTKIGSVISGLRDVVGTNDLMAYLVMIAIRLLELHRVLKPTGSLYLHCDPTASHYLKIILDSIFGIENFLNEVVWKRYGSHNDSKRYANVHDTIFYYVKNKNKRIWNKLYLEYDDEYVKNAYSYNDKNGAYTTSPLQARSLSGGGYNYTWKGITDTWKFPQQRLDELDKQGLIHWPKTGSTPRRKVYLKDAKGLPVTDMFLDVKSLSSSHKERMDYPTQKPLALLERIISASSNEGGTVLDPFCGCGTAVIAAEKLGRAWIGIDITHLAVNLIEKRLHDSFGIKAKIIGVPQSLEAAQKLADADKFQFELWAINLIPKLHSNEKQVGDRGIDGRGQIMVGLGEDNRPKYEKIIASVKGGNQTNPSMVRDLVGTVKSEGAAFGIFICIKKPTKRMQEAAVKGGIYTTPLGRQYQRVQIYTIEDYFNRLTPDIPDLVDSMKGQKQKRQARAMQTTF